MNCHTPTPWLVARISPAILAECYAAKLRLGYSPLMLRLQREASAKVQLAREGYRVSPYVLAFQSDRPEAIAYRARLAELSKVG